MNLSFPPRFIRDLDQLQQVDRQHKLYHCPHCRRAGALIKHGWLRGFGPLGWIKGIRARRLFCSTRGSRPGCGRSVSVFFTEVLPRLSLTSALLWSFLAAIVRRPRTSILAAWQSLPTTVSRSPTTGYRIHRRLRHSMPMLRTALTRLHPPPTEVVSGDDPLAALVAHLNCPAPKGVRQRTRVVELPQVNQVLMQPHWRTHRDQSSQTPD